MSTHIFEGNIKQIAVGNYNVLIGSIHGGIVTINMPDPKPQIKSRPIPVFLRPRSLPAFLGRQKELRIIITELQDGRSVEIRGESGIGKTSILRYLAYHSIIDAFPGGVIYLSANQQPIGDLLHCLFDAFYESDHPFKPTQARIKHDIQNKQALILLDDIDLTRKEVQLLMDTALACTFVLASQDSHLWGEGRAISLKGLTGDEARKLVEREIDRSLSPEEQSEIETLVAALDGSPLSLKQAIALAIEKGYSLVEIINQLKTDIPAKAVAEQLLALLSEPEQQIMAALAVFHGTALHIEHLAGLTDLPDIGSYLESLLRRRLVEAQGSYYSLPGSTAQVVPLWLDTSSWTERALNYFINWAEQVQQTPDRLLAEMQTIRQVLAWAANTGRWSEVIRLVVALEGALALSGNWSIWEQVLQRGLQSARAMKDLKTEAWALHQLGTRALCLGETSKAREFLTQALDLRKELGNQEAIKITRDNLALLDRPEVEEESQTSSNRDSPILPRKRSFFTWPIIGSAVLISILFLLGGLVAWSGLSSSLTSTSVAEVPSSTFTPSRTSMPTLTPTGKLGETILLPTSTPTDTLTPTFTPVPPTATPTPTPTFTPLPPTSTNTPLPPTFTFTPLPPPTDTPTPIPPTPTPIPLPPLQPQANGLQRGSNTFQMSFLNTTPNYTFRVPLVASSWAIVDNLGNNYVFDKGPSFDRETMFNTPLTINVPPNTNPSEKIILTSPINLGASSITFTLRDVWAQQAGSQFSQPIGDITWVQTVP